MSLYAFENARPSVDPEAFVHPDAVLIGDVRIGKKCFIGACAVLRADFSPITVGDGSNVQENCALHVTPGLLKQEREAVPFKQHCHLNRIQHLHFKRALARTRKRVLQRVIFPNMK